MVAQFVGTDDMGELDQIELVLRSATMAESDRVGMLNQIHTLKEVR